MSMEPAFPIPVIDAITQPWWDAAARGELVIQRCPACDTWLWAPTPICSQCQHTKPIWHPVNGDGRIASWTVIRPPTLAVYADLVPLVVLLVELDEGPRLIGNLVDGDGLLLRTDGAAEGVAIGRRAHLRFMRQGDLNLPCWTLGDD